MSFISEDILLRSLTTLVKEGFNTTQTSSLVYFFALSRLLKSNDTSSISLDKDTLGREAFISNISDLIEIDGEYIWHPIRAFDDMTSWNKGKSLTNFVSSNLLTNAYSRKQKGYPSRSPLLDFSTGEAAIHEEYQENLNHIFSGFPNYVLKDMCIWLLRTHDFHEERVSISNLLNTINNLYGFDIDIDIDIDDEITDIEIDTSAQQSSSLTLLLRLVNEKVKIKRGIESSYHDNSQKIRLSKPFLLLAGISGTGKTRFVRKQVEDNKNSSISDTYCLTSVRPDWHEPSDILGYISRLGGDGNAKYITTDVLQFIAKAWRAIIDSGLELEPKGNGLAVIGDKSELEQVLPYWLCLDEMNLAPVEQYFADYLSILETREWQWEDEHFTYYCDSILKSGTIKELGDKSKLRKALGFTGEQYDDAWDLFCDHGLGLPFNLIVAGTVNMDETTHGFSRKVIDRALSFDFGDFFPNEFDHFFKPKVIHNALSYPIYSQASINKLPPIDSDGSKSISFLKSINKVLNDTPFQLAFRALNELLLAVISTYPEDEKQLQAVWDDFLMCKVLPRIEGDHDKLAVIDDSVISHEKSLLTELTAILRKELVDIWSMEDNHDKLRPDLYRKNIDGSVLYIACRSKSKLTWMQQRLERSGFTNFWP